MYALHSAHPFHAFLHIPEFHVLISDSLRFPPLAAPSEVQVISVFGADTLQRVGNFKNKVTTPNEFPKSFIFYKINIY
jgi:hypothetical protein